MHLWLIVFRAASFGLARQMHFSWAMKKQDQIQIELLISSIQDLSGLSWREIKHPVGQEAKRWRRVSLWAFARYAGIDVVDLKQQFSIGAKQSVYRILQSQSLCADEYNYRKKLQFNLEAKRLNMAA